MGLRFIACLDAAELRDFEEEDFFLPDDELLLDEARFFVPEEVFPFVAAIKSALLKNGSKPFDLSVISPPARLSRTSAGRLMKKLCLNVIKSIIT